MADIVATRHRLDGQTYMRRVRDQRKLGFDGGALRVRIVGRFAVRSSWKTEPLRARG